MHLLYTLIAAALLSLPATAVLIDSGDGSGNTSAPPDDPGWDHVGVRGGHTAVYIGNGWVITANHVGLGDVTLGGVLYPHVPGSKVRLQNDDGSNTDCAVFQLDPAPPLPALPIRATSPPAGAEVVSIGYGRNRGAAITWNGRDGYEWASGKALRWGRNLVEGPSLAFGTEAFYVAFDQEGLEHESQVVSGDSGGAAFVREDGAWQLAGVLFARTVYGGQPSNTSFFGNRSLVVDLSAYRDEIALLTFPACRNGIDDDGDGLADHPDDPGCDDPDDPSELSAELLCDDGVDNDGDGNVDYPADEGCPEPAWFTENPACSDGVDNDLDGFVDFDGGGSGAPDPECAGTAWRAAETEHVCGIGFELAFVLLALRRLRARLRPPAGRGRRRPYF